jgi:hypothetical protein
MFLRNVSSTGLRGFTLIRFFVCRFDIFQNYISKYSRCVDASVEVIFFNRYSGGWGGGGVQLGPLGTAVTNMPKC